MIVPGIPTPQDILINNFGNIGADFLYLIIAPPYITIDGVYNAELLYNLSNIVVVHLWLSPQETKDIKVITVLNPNRVSYPDHENSSAGVSAHDLIPSALAIQLASLSRQDWDNLKSLYPDPKALIWYAYNQSITQEIQFYSNISEYVKSNQTQEQFLNSMNVLHSQYPDLGDYIATQLIERSYIDYMYYMALASQVNSSPNNQSKGFSALGIPDWGEFLKDFFNPIEFSETENKALCGLFAGSIEALSFGLVRFNNTNDDFLLWKKVGYWTTLGISALTINLAGLGKGILTRYFNPEVVGFPGRELVGLTEQELMLRKAVAFERFTFIDPTLTRRGFPAWGFEFMSARGGEYTIGKVGYNLARNGFNPYIGFGSVGDMQTALHLYFEDNGFKLVPYVPYKGYVEVSIPNGISGRAPLASLPFVVSQYYLGKVLTDGLFTFNTPSFCGPSPAMEVRTSNDPNFMSVHKPYFNSISPQTFTIKFENEENASAPAYNVHVEITLKGYNTSTFKLLYTDHPQSLSRIVIGNNTVDVFFHDINLTPNVNPPEGEAYLTFSVLPKNMSPGQTIYAYSEVTFDFNPPVMTNIVNQTYDPLPPFSRVSVQYLNSTSVRLNIYSVDEISPIAETFLHVKDLLDPEFDYNLTIHPGSNVLNYTKDINLPQKGIYIAYVHSIDLAHNVEVSKTSSLFSTYPIVNSTVSIVQGTYQKSFVFRNGLSIITKGFNFSFPVIVVSYEYLNKSQGNAIYYGIYTNANLTGVTVCHSNKTVTGFTGMYYLSSGLYKQANNISSRNSSICGEVNLGNQSSIEFLLSKNQGMGIQGNLNLMNYIEISALAFAIAIIVFIFIKRARR